MRALRAIVAREIGSFFHGAIAPVVLVGFLVGVGLFFTLFVLAYSELSLTAMQSARHGNYLNLAEGLFRPLVSNMTFFLLLLLPAVTMRLFAPDYRSGRWELVASWPVADPVWVVGKWLATVAVGALLIAASSAYFGAVWLLGHPEPGPLLVAFLGLLLLTGALAAWGVLASVLVSHQIVAYFLTFAWSMLLYLVGALDPHLPDLLGRVCRELSILAHFQRFSHGVLDSRDVTYFLLLAAVPLVAATAALTGRRLPPRRQGFLWALPVLATLAAVAVYVLVSLFPWSADLTTNRRYSLAPQTLRVLDDLPAHLAAADTVAGAAPATGIEVLAFYQSLDPALEATRIMLEAFNQRTRHFRYRVVDPEEELELVRRHGVTTTRTVVVVAGERSTILLQPSETALTNAVYRMATGRRTVVYHVQGHGEKLLESDGFGGFLGFADALAEQSYELRKLQLPLTGRVPVDADVLVIAGPRTEPGPEELVALEDYLRRGGGMLVLLDPPTPAAWREWMTRWRIGVSGDVLISAELAATEYGVKARTVVVGDTYGSHEVSDPLMGVATVFPLAQALTVVGEPDSVVAGAIILRTEDMVWAERDPASRFSGPIRFDRDVDAPGPLDFGMVVEASLDPEGPPGRLVVIGNSEFLNNANLNLGGNRDLALNALGWLARQEGLIALQGRDPLHQPVVLDRARKNVLGWGSVLGWPLLVGSLAVGVMLRHRRRGGAS